MPPAVTGPCRSPRVPQPGERSAAPQPNMGASHGKKVTGRVCSEPWRGDLMEKAPSPHVVPVLPRVFRRLMAARDYREGTRSGCGCNSSGPD